MEEYDLIEDALDFYNNRLIAQVYPVIKIIAYKSTHRLHIELFTGHTYHFDIDERYPRD